MDTVILCSVSAIIQVMAHYFPWDRMLQRDMPRPAAYTVGILGIMIPLTILSIYRQITLIDVWSSVIASGIAVTLVYLLDAALDDQERKVVMRAMQEMSHRENEQ